ncbi:hypothetical protein BHE74_00019531 [Ensete ventricosum]|nr:hypothetical protein BHE74_00019531 [Ensete ventricosum]
MASADGRGLRRFLFRSSSSSSSRPHAAADRNALIGPPPPPPPPQPRPSSPARKKGLAAAAFRGLGCASAAASQAYAPAVAAVRSSADWQGKRPRRRRAKKKKKEGRGADVWCAPGMPFAAEASVDCVMAHQPMVGRGRFDAAERIHREVVVVVVVHLEFFPIITSSSRRSDLYVLVCIWHLLNIIDGILWQRPYIPRRASHQEQISSAMDSPSNLETPFYGPGLLPLGHLRHLRGYHRTPGGLEEVMHHPFNLSLSQGLIYMVVCNLNSIFLEVALIFSLLWTYIIGYQLIKDLSPDLPKLQIMMFQTRVLLRGGMVVYDQFRDWRLDVDNMSYEMLSVSSLLIQEEYERNDETGRLQCGHSFHINCIKKWLLLKNACPVCKTPVLKT